MSKKKKHKEITVEDIDQFLEEFYKDKSDVTYDLLRSKILSGYKYSIIHKKSNSNERNTSLFTGKNGVLLILNTFEEMGIPAYLAGEDIICYTEQGPFPIKDLNIVKNG